MRVIVASHESAMKHDTGRGHPERPDRVLAVRRGLEKSGVEPIELESPLVSRSDLGLVHDPSYIGMIETFCSLGGGALDMDTVASEESWEAALRSAGSVLALIDALEEGPDAFGFALTRPPGHHAMTDRAMGFCIFNNLAIAATWLRSHGSKVAILDWDVHHGNGTQDIVGPDEGLLYVSIHQSPFYPFGGRIADIDEPAKGTTLNIPLPARTAGDVYRRAWSELVIPVVSQFAPEWILVSAGYDAHARDPLADLQLIDSDYGWLAARISEVHSPSRTIFALEGGYDLEALETSVDATVKGMSGQDGGWSPPLTSPPGSATALEDAARAFARHWSL